jgi:hypothetical protein
LTSVFDVLFLDETQRILLVGGNFVDSSTNISKGYFYSSFDMKKTCSVGQAYTISNLDSGVLSVAITAD